MADDRNYGNLPVNPANLPGARSMVNKARGRGLHLGRGLESPGFRGLSGAARFAAINRRLKPASINQNIIKPDVGRRPLPFAAPIVNSTTPPPPSATGALLPRRFGS